MKLPSTRFYIFSNSSSVKGYSINFIYITLTTKSKSCCLRWINSIIKLSINCCSSSISSSSYSSKRTTTTNVSICNSKLNWSRSITCWIISINIYTIITSICILCRWCKKCSYTWGTILKYSRGNKCYIFYSIVYC